MKTELSLAFKKEGQKKRYWHSGERVLAAVSGGVDSMVLLELLLGIQKEFHLELGVVHINHQLRPESALEEDYLRKYCDQKGIPFYVARWEENCETGMEAAARKFRYQFFSNVMTEQGYDTLMTAHHQDDQVETMLMKMIRGGNFQEKQGILPERVFAGGRLVRPLLSFSKKMIRRFAEKRQIKYFEDDTNALPLYERNRMRIVVLPELKKENSKTVEHLMQFSQQLRWAKELIDAQAEEQYQKFAVEKEQEYCLNAEMIAEIPTAQQYFFWEYFFGQTMERYCVSAKQSRLEEILRLFESQKPQWTLFFENNWKLIRTYQQLRFFQDDDEKTVLEEEVISVDSTGVYLTTHEWLAVFPEAELIEMPAATSEWQEIRKEIQQPIGTNFSVRHKQDGDRIQLSPSLSKKISRYFIDEKIPISKRKEAWLLCNDQKDILGMLPYAFSYLSIAAETDTIQYTLVYRYKTDLS